MRTNRLRVPVALLEEVSRLADQRGGTMQDVAAEAVYRLSQDQLWASVRSALNNLGAAEMASYQVESGWLDAAAADGLDEH